MKSRTAHVPVRLLHLPMQIYCCGEVLVEQFDRFSTDVLGKGIVSKLHAQLSKIKDVEADEIVLDLVKDHTLQRWCGTPERKSCLCNA